MRTCEICGRPTVAKNAHARFCSPKCRVTAHRKRKRATIPAEMIRRNRWVRWEPSKRPITVDGHPASSTNPDTWSGHGEATQSTAGIGIGFVLGDGIGCIDMDHCLNNGQPSTAAKEIIARYPNNYIETSPSGDGLHIWGLLPEQPGTKRIVNGVHVETYSVARYITVTGNVFQPGELLPL